MSLGPSLRPPSLGEMTARTRLQSGAGPTIDLFQTADDIVTLFKAGDIAEAIVDLERARRGRSQVVQDTLDRLVSARSPLCYAPPAGSGAAVATLARIAFARYAAPRMPDAGQMTALTEQQRHDVYASMVEVRGSGAANAAAAAGNRVILGLRLSQSTLVKGGQGQYTDRIIVVRRQGRTRNSEVFMAANTQPTAQYDGNQRKTPGIIFRRADGEDITKDGIPELGRLTTGTYALLATTHDNPKTAGTNFSLRPTPAAVAAGANQVERDSNHDGLFTATDPNRLSPLNNTFKIHSGSRANTDSSGCQTIAPSDFLRFSNAVKGGTQTVWQYVLTEVQP